MGRCYLSCQALYLNAVPSDLWSHEIHEDLHLERNCFEYLLGHHGGNCLTDEMSTHGVQLEQVNRRALHRRGPFLQSCSGNHYYRRSLYPALANAGDLVTQFAGQQEVANCWNLYNHFNVLRIQRGTIHLPIQDQRS